MKNILFGIILLAASNYSTAQNDTIYEENYRVLADMLFSNLDSSIYGPNLLNRSFSTSEVVQEQLNGNYSRVSSVVEFLECYQAISYSYLDTSFMMNVDSAARFIENEFIINEQNSGYNELIIPFGLVLHTMSYIDTTKANTTHFSFANNNLVPLSSENSLYKTALIKSAAVLEFYPDNGYKTGKLKYTKGLVSHSPDISNLNLMINVGNGYEFFNEQKNIVSFSRLKDSLIGSLAISYKKGNSIYFDTLPFYVVTDANINLNKAGLGWDQCDYCEDWQAPGSITPFYSYDIGILYGCGTATGSFRKPIIIVPPYRPSVQQVDLQLYYDQFNFAGVLTSLSRMGYDVIFLKLKPGNASLEFAGEYLAKFIDWVNVKKLQDYPNEHWENTIIGFSMGGQVARYALKYMEREHMVSHKPHHHTRLYIPYDSPHLGANIPMFTQAVYKDLASSNIFAALTYNALKDEASKDMAVTHIIGSPIVETGNLTDGKILDITPIPTSQRTSFVNALTNSLNHQFTSLTDLRRSYPTFTRNVAVSAAKNDQNYNTEFGLYPGRLLFDQPGVLGIGYGGIYAKTRRFYASLHGPASTVFKNKEQFLFLGLIPITTRNREYRTVFAAEWDLAQGGYKNEFYKGVGTSAMSILRLGTFGIGYQEYSAENISFLPLVSALGINPTIWSPNNLFYNVKDEGLMYNIFDFDPIDGKSNTFGYPNLDNPNNHFNITPFEAVYCDIQTYEHIKMQESVNQNNGNNDYLEYTRDFILNEVESDYFYLQNKTIGLNHTQSDPGYRYKAWYKAYDKIIIGKEVTPKTDVGPYIIQSTGDIVVYACKEIVLSAGFESQEGSSFHGYIRCDNCSRPRSSASGSYTEADNDEQIGNDKIPFDIYAQDTKVNDIQVYPNPSNGEITITITSELNNAFYELYDVLGNNIKSGFLQQHKTLLDLNLGRGFFILWISNHGKQFIKKIQIL